jgi:DNA-binding Lrp family transcriptional regulator
MSKTILATVDGFTPLIDGVVKEIGIVAAAVFGKAWRYCQMPDGVCRASQERLANELGISRATINTCLDKLVKAGYFRVEKKEGFPNIYIDTGKANVSISLTGGCQNPLQGGVKEFDTKKEDKREIINAANKKVDVILGVELNQQGLDKKAMQTRFETLLRISPAWEGTIWRDFDGWLLSQERKGRKIEDWVTWWNSDDFRRDKQTVNLNPSKIKQNWNIAFDSGVTVTQERGGMYV